MIPPRKHSYCVLLVMVVAATPAWGQEVHGSLDLGSEAGYLSNPFLDPTIAYWDPSLRASYGALAPSGRLHVSGQRSSLQVVARGRYTVFSDETTPWGSGGVQMNAQLALNNSLTVALDGAASVFRGDFEQGTLRVLPSVAWNVSPRVRVRARSGAARQAIVPHDSDAWHTTTILGTLEAERWIGRSTRLGASVHASRSETAAQEEPLQGIGAAVHTARWMSGGALLRAELGVEQYGYRAALEGGSAGGVPDVQNHHDMLWRAFLTGEWPMARSTTLFARLGGSLLQSTAMAGHVGDVQGSLGLRFSISGRLYSPPEPPPVWQQEGSVVHVCIHYDGEGALYLVGDFNRWSMPGQRMRRIEGDVFTTELRVEPGTYLYRVRVVSGTDEHWLTLPAHALTVADEYGGRNGLLIVEPSSDESPDTL